MKKRAFEAELVILAIGAIPNTDYLEDTPIRLNQQDGAVCVNKFLETSVKDVYAAGDVTQFPTEFSAKGRASICHWGIATHHGKVVAQNMMGKEVTVHQIVPFFWTAVAGVNVRYAGYGEGHSDTAIFGSLESMEFCTLYRRSNRALGIATVNCDPLAAEMADEFQTGIKYKHDYPIAVLKRFPKPPVVGEKYFGFKEDIAEFANYDLRNAIAKKPVDSDSNRRKSRSIVNLTD
jgi:NADPH-dependent 2,4-dienoyl-CoA reductase/sulfur reductase-like enzyme